MHRFRKKSDVKRGQVPVFDSYSADAGPPKLHSAPPENLPEIASDSDFRTSLILTEISKRFSQDFLDPHKPKFTVDSLRDRLAKQRARGAENYVTEEEEDMFLESLGLRSKLTPSTNERENFSNHSTPTPSILSPPGTPQSSRSKRYSNNLFGSGRLRDYSYLKTVNQQKNGGRVQSSSSDSLRPVTPDSTMPPSSVQSSPSGNDSSYYEEDIPPRDLSRSGLTSLKPGSASYKRASMAVEEAIKELEEESDEKIVMPRSTPRMVNNGDVYGGFAISPEPTERTEFEERRMSPVPSRVAHGYVPGMPRPLTPRDPFDSDDQRSMTPRATSPPQNESPPTEARSSRPISPLGPNSSLFLHRPTNGRYTPESRARSPDNSFRFPPPPNGGAQSPSLAGQAYQAMSKPSRPSTPSNVTWATPSESHSRHDSNWSASDNGSSEVGTMELGSTLGHNHTKSAPRSLTSPALPDSPILSRGHSISNNTSPPPTEYRALSPIYSPDLRPSGLPSPAPLRSMAKSPDFFFAQPPSSPSKHEQSSSDQEISSGSFSFENRALFSPIANSSRSSLESQGSSYHSHDGGPKERLLDIFSDRDPSQAAWHDLSQTTSALLKKNEAEAEQIVSKYSGLSKNDFVAIQGKLFGIASSKAQGDTPNRSQSLRRRRPSTSQSVYSITAGDFQPASPPPPQLSTPSPIRPSFSQESSHNALLNSIVDSLKTSDEDLAEARASELDRSQSSGESSPGTERRNRDLAEVLFGGRSGSDEDEEEDEDMTEKEIMPSRRPIEPLQTFKGRSKSPSVNNYPSLPTSPPALSPLYPASRNPSSPRLPSNPQEEAELTREVQRKAEVAMLALKGRPSQTNLADPSTPIMNSASVRRKVKPGQISTPTLVSSTTSLDTVPLPMANSVSSNASSSKLGSRLKRLRGTLRKAPTVPNGEEVTPFPLDHDHTASPSPATPIQSGRASMEQDRARAHTPAQVKPNEGLSRAPTGSSSASGPGLKSFMSRFRNRPRNEDEPRHVPSQLPMLNVAASSVGASRTRNQAPRSASAQQILHLPAISPVTDLFTPPQSAPLPDAQTRHEMETKESAALKQLLDAASSLGLDQGKLNDLLLVRSPSTSSRATGITNLTRDNSVSTPGTSRRPSVVDKYHSKTSSQGMGAPSLTKVEEYKAPPTVTVGRSASHKSTKNQDAPRKRNRDAVQSVIVRRTIIRPSDFEGDLSALLPKRQHRSSAMSGRSVQGRTSTPPPPQGGHRVSTDNMPPLPSSSFLSVPGGPIEKSNSAYDSLYEMYSEEPESTPNGLGPNTALELSYYSNGEVVWDIVKGLRDDDAESLYTSHRGSFDSQFSDTRDDGMKVFFKPEHGRSGSKGSTSSFGLRKKQAETRPVTEIFLAPSAQIGRILEDLSSGRDAGRFNFSLDNQGNYGHSTTSSLSGTVEDKLDKMIGSLRTE